MNIKGLKKAIVAIKTWKNDKPGEKVYEYKIHVDGYTDGVNYYCKQGSWPFLWSAYNEKGDILATDETLRGTMSLVLAGKLVNDEVLNRLKEKYFNGGK